MSQEGFTIEPNLPGKPIDEKKSVIKIALELPFPFG
jgi:hypothetical protein